MQLVSFEVSATDPGAQGRHRTGPCVAFFCDQVPGRQGKHAVRPVVLAARQLKDEREIEENLQANVARTEETAITIGARHSAVGRREAAHDAGLTLQRKHAWHSQLQR